METTQEAKDYYESRLKEEAGPQRRCRGHCCRRFYLPFTPEGLQEERQRAMDGKSRFNAAEIIYVADMVIPLDNKTDANNEGGPCERGYYYTCKYHDTVSGNCMRYNARPRVCSDYPYGRECSYHKCAVKPLWKRYALSRWLHKKLFEKPNPEVEGLLKIVKEVEEKCVGPCA